MQQNEELEAWKNATWDFILEHCDLLESGTLFVKFHMSDRRNFEKRIAARLRGYHREDVVKKNDIHATTRKETEEEKEAKHQKYLAEREERRKALARVKKINDRRVRVRKVLSLFI